MGTDISTIKQLLQLVTQVDLPKGYKHKLTSGIPLSEYEMRYLHRYFNKKKGQSPIVDEIIMLLEQYFHEIHGSLEINPPPLEYDR